MPTMPLAHLRLGYGTELTPVRSHRRISVTVLRWPLAVFGLLSPLGVCGGTLRGEGQNIRRFDDKTHAVILATARHSWIKSDKMPI